MLVHDVYARVLKVPVVIRVVFPKCKVLLKPTLQTGWLHLTRPRPTTATRPLCIPAFLELVGAGFLEHDSKQARLRFGESCHLLIVPAKLAIAGIAEGKRVNVEGRVGGASCN